MNGDKCIMDFERARRRLNRMKTLALLLACVGWACGNLSSVSLGATDRNKGVQKVQMVGEPGSAISADSNISVSFPTAMVPAAQIDVEAKESPIRFDPPLRGKFIWKSQTEGEFAASEVPPGTEFKVFLSQGLVDLAGKPVVAKQSLGTRVSEAFTVETFFNEEKLDRRPSVPVRFSVNVRPANLAESAWFQDRDSRQRFPVEVVLQEHEGETVESATVTPRVDLPGGRTFDLVVEGLKDAKTGTKLSLPFVSPLGETEALKVVKVAAFNYPMQKRRVVVEFSEPVDPAEGRKIKIEPEVAVQCVAKGEELWMEGDFDISQRYRVTVPADVVGKRGFAMAAESRWGATFHAKKAALIFPTEDLHQRSQLGMRFAFIQVNSGALQWKLARVPPDKLLAINKRVREFTEKQKDPVSGTDAEDPESGLPKWTPSELLIDASRLETVAHGAIAASPAEADTRREILWKPEKGFPAGAYVLEVTGKNAEGKTIANRALITFTEYAAAQKRFGDTCLLHVMNIADGHSVPGMRIRAVNAENEFIAEAVTDGNGLARFQREALSSSYNNQASFLLDTPDGPMLQPVGAARCGGGYSYGRQDGEKPQFRMAITSDRPLYRPGQTLKFKGFAREVGPDHELRIPRAREVTWRISGGDNHEEELAKGTTKLDDFGGFEGEWMVPKTVKVSQYQISASFQGTSAQQYFAVQEFRPPPFLVSLADSKLPGAQSGVRISSAYFHGAPNAGARVRWKADWRGRTSGDSGVVVTDRPREASEQRFHWQAVSGEGVLANDGSLEVKSVPPFKDGIPRGWYDVEWRAEVTAQDGQTITESARFPVFAVPVQLSVSGSELPKKSLDKAETMTISLKADAMGPEEKPVVDTLLSVEVYRVISKTVKEQISPNVYRYRNSISYEKGEKVLGRAPMQKNVSVKMAGEYLAVVRHSENPTVPAVAGRVYVSGPGEAEFPFRDEVSIGVTCDKPSDDADPNSGYAPGETAVLSVQSPFSGTAWVSVEAEGVIDMLTLPLEGNSGRIELPIKKEYGPNAWVTVYLLHPGGADRLPSERFGAVPIKVRRPDLDLKVTPVMASKQVQPKETISGEIVVTSEDQPVAHADVTVYAVDEAVLDAGDWHEPALKNAMYPQRAWNVSTFHGLERLSSGVDSTSLHQKGFIIGDVNVKCASASINVKDLRTDFPPLAFWKTHLQTDRHGKVAFSFKAPDGLTKYRIIALAQTKQSQFGTGSDWVELSKPVQVEPALPRFLRVGDEVELRAIVRQKIADELPVKVRCSTGLKLVGDSSQKQTVRRNIPSVFRFRASVGEMETAAVRFETDAGAGDAVELTLPVHPPTLLRKESIFGTLPEAKQRIPEDWTKASGSVDVTLSTSPWLPKLTGLPLLLEYPHGCFEQVTSRILGYTVLNELLAYLPEPTSREKAYRKRIESGIDRMANGLTPEGYLPYWPGGKPSALPTVAGYWATTNAASQGISVPGPLKEKLANAVRAIALGDKSAPADSFARAFALMVLSENGKLGKAYGSMIREMYLRREGLGEEARAFLAIAMHRSGIMPDEKQQLLREIDRPLKERAFDPDTFGSTTRAEAIRALAFATLDPEGTSGKAREELRTRIDALLESSQSLSTQENFWLLFAFKTMHPAVQGPPVAFRSAKPVPEAISRNGASALWSSLDIRKLQKFAVRVDRSDSLTCLMEAQFRTDSPITNRTDNGFRVERVVKNLTDASRTGAADAPFHLGDQILITYRLVSPKLHHYVALEDELPAALETVNPSIASIARTYSVPQEKGTQQLSLSFSELRDRITCLYFDRVEPGVAVYSVLARATCAGAFHWPATQAVPMYDSRFSGLSPSSVCHVVGE